MSRQIVLAYQCRVRRLKSVPVAGKTGTYQATMNGATEKGKETSRDHQGYSAEG